MADGSGSGGGTRCSLCGKMLVDASQVHVCHDVAKNVDCEHRYCTGCVLTKAWTGIPDPLVGPVSRCDELVWELQRTTMRVVEKQGSARFEVEKVELAGGKPLKKWVMPRALRNFADLPASERVNSFALCLLTPKNDGTFQVWQTLLQRGGEVGQDAVKAIKQLGAPLSLHCQARQQDPGPRKSAWSQGPHVH